MTRFTDGVQYKCPEGNGDKLNNKYQRGTRNRAFETAYTIGVTIAHILKKLKNCENDGNN